MRDLHIVTPAKLFSLKIPARGIPLLGNPEVSAKYSAGYCTVCWDQGLLVLKCHGVQAGMCP